MKNSESAAADFAQAKRNDLQQKEMKQIAVLEEYLPANQLNEKDVTSAIEDVIGKLRIEGKDVTQGTVMKTLVGPGGSLVDQNVDRKDVARLVSGLL